MNQSRDELNKRYPIGTLVKLKYMYNEPHMPYGLTGTIIKIDDLNQIHVKWINGSLLALNINTDIFIKVDKYKDINSYITKTLTPFYLKTHFQHNCNKLNCEATYITKAITLSGEDYNYLCSHLLTDLLFFTKIQDAMGYNNIGKRQSVAIISNEHCDGILVDTQGYKYARYFSFIPHLKDIVENYLVS